MRSYNLLLLFLIILCLQQISFCQDGENSDQENEEGIRVPFTLETNDCFIECQERKNEFVHPEWEKYPTYLTHKQKLEEQTFQVRACMSKFRPHNYHGNITASETCLEFADELEEHPADWDTNLFGKCLDSCSHYTNLTIFQEEINCMYGCTSYKPTYKFPEIKFDELGSKRYILNIGLVLLVLGVVLI